MTKNIVISILVVGFLAIGIFAWQVEKPLTLGGQFDGNSIPGLRVHSTTTTNGVTGPCSGKCPILLLSANEYDTYARFDNVSAVTMYLHATSSPLDITGTGQPRTATTSLPYADGIKGIQLAAGEAYEVDDNNYIDAYWYATTTDAVAAGIINVQYK